MALDSINWALIAPVIAIQVLLTLVALIDWIKLEETKGPKWLWLIIILFVNIIGPIIYFIFGRKE